MRSVPIMELRRHLGELLDEVRLKAETLVLERAGRPVAMIVPITPADDTGHRAAQRQRLRGLQRLTGAGAATPRSPDLDAWLQDERNSWH